MVEFRHVVEIKSHLVTSDDLQEKIRSGKNAFIRGHDAHQVIGQGCLVKVNASVGMSKSSDLTSELAKVKAVETMRSGPDLMMDLSVCRPNLEITQAIRQCHKGPIGSLPHYVLAGETTGALRIGSLLSEMQSQINAGVTFFTIHPTPSIRLVEMASRTRRTPFTSRGGGIVIRDMYGRHAKKSLFHQHFDEICDFCAEQEIGLSIGTAFRPASVSDALDEVHLAEIDAQSEYVTRAKAKGVQVLFEAVGHATLDKIARLSEIVQRIGFPMMALGPMPVDCAVGFDHVSNAIGAAAIGFLGGAHIINAVTREEHTGGIPSMASFLEGIWAARVAAHAVNLTVLGSISRQDRELADERARKRTCAVAGGLFDYETGHSPRNCTRCGTVCPLLIRR